MAIRFILCTLALWSVSGCVQYRNHNDGIGQLKSLQSLGELQGTYISKPVNHGNTPLSPYGTLSYWFGLTLEVKGDLRGEAYARAMDPAAMVRLTVVNDQQLLMQAFDERGQLVVQKTQNLAPEYAFSPAGLCETRTTWGSSTSVEAGTRDSCYTLNDKGNLVHRIAVRATGNVIPAIIHTTDYAEYTRVQ